MSQAGRAKHFARSATRARSARRGKLKNKAPVDQLANTAFGLPVVLLDGLLRGIVGLRLTEREKKNARYCFVLICIFLAGSLR